MNILQNSLKKICIFAVFQALVFMPAFALDLDSTVNDAGRKTYSNKAQTTQTPSSVEQKQTENVSKNQVEQSKSEPVKQTLKQDLPTVPKVPNNVNSSTVAPLNTQYSGKMPTADALIPCTDIKTGGLIIDNKVVKSQTSKQTKTVSAQSKQQKVTYKTSKLPKGTQIRVMNQNKITDYLSGGQGVVFVSTQDVSTPYFIIPKNTKFTAKVMDSHRPQMTCNGGLVGLRFVSAQINGYNQTIDGGLIKLKTDRIYFSNLKGEHTYKKNVCKKAKWGQNKFRQYSKTSHKLANQGAGVIIAPFPYLGGCVLAAASTISSPVTALLGKGGNLNIPAKTTFTMKLYDDAKLRR